MPLMNQATQAYCGYFVILCIICFILYLRSEAVDSVTTTREFKLFQRKFLVVYLLAYLADWMQGPYFYALYSHYGYSMEDIGRLFIAGYLSSLFFGTLMGPLADRFGRKRNIMLYGVLYGISCVLMHSSDFNVLVVGRLLGGCATSILYSSFEAWMIHEHNDAAYPIEWLSHTFQIMTLGNSLSAILGSLLALTVVHIFHGPDSSYTAPFDVSFVILVVGVVCTSVTLPENYGNQNALGGIKAYQICISLRKAVGMILNSGRILMLGVVQSCFEAAMFIFVFLWTPALARGLPSQLPHGLIFASFMVCCMIGAFIFKAAVNSSLTVQSFTRFVLFAASLALAVPVMVEDHWCRFFAFCVFEVCVGIYFPSIGTLRGRLVPNEVRATVMNLFRCGLNIIVVVVLYNIEHLQEKSAFLICFCLLSTGMLAQGRLHSMMDSNMSTSRRMESGFEPDASDMDKADAHA